MPFGELERPQVVYAIRHYATGEVEVVSSEELAGAVIWDELIHEAGASEELSLD